jgi:hypothetical protein
MEAACFSETVASTDESTRRQNPEEHHHPHRRENLKYHILRYLPDNVYLLRSKHKHTNLRGMFNK